MSDELSKTNPPIVGETATSQIVHVEAVGYANVINGSFILTLCAAHWTPHVGASTASVDACVVSRLRFTEEFAKELHSTLGRMIAANAQPEGQVN